jgi:hypothetical protein
MSDTSYLDDLSSYQNHSAYALKDKMFWVSNIRRVGSRNPTVLGKTEQPMRARLNPLDPSNKDGVYFHGQFGDAFHSEGWTHGCLSYGRDTTMINYMGDHFGNAWTEVSVNTPVVKP